MNTMVGYKEAKAHLEHISELLVALQLDYDRYHEAKDDIQITQDSLSHTNTEEELRELQAEIADYDLLRLDCEDSDGVMELIMEYPLSIEVRSGWCSAADFEEAKPEEFCILLSTGGPAVRIMGELDEDGHPDRAWIEYCDWSTPWTVFDSSNKAILEFAQLFVYRY